MINLDSHQQVFVDKIQEALAGEQDVVAVSPTGSGKTVCLTAISKQAQCAVGIVAHRREIVFQISKALARLEIPHRAVLPTDKIRLLRRLHLKEFNRSWLHPGAQVGVLSVQTVCSKSSEADNLLQSWINSVRLLILDECHHYVKQGYWGKILSRFGNARHLGFTACPARTDGKGLGKHASGFADVMVEAPDTYWHIKNGYLSQFDYFAPDSSLDMTGAAHGKDGDFTRTELRARVRKSKLTGDVVDHYKKYCPGKKCLVFATDIETAITMAANYNATGVPAIELDGKTDDAKREQGMQDFANGIVKVVVSVDLFDEGLDIPGAEAVILARPTESLNKFLQMIGRILRVVYVDGFVRQGSTAEDRLAAIAAGPKGKAIVIDAVDNFSRHGAPNYPRQWSLDNREKRTISERDTVPEYKCTACTRPYEKFYKACPYCGEPAPQPDARASALEQVQGDLTALDVDTMAALEHEIARADMSCEEYREDQARRHIPEIGRKRDMRRHLEALEKRKVLKEVVAWWVGMQPGRELGEVHRRFNYRFGIDIGTAMTLKAKETEALIGRIVQRFEEDLR